MVPYLFDPTNNAIDSLVEHVYSKSISEVIIKIMNIEESSFTEDLATAI
jgi:hypothetical protein